MLIQALTDCFHGYFHQDRHHDTVLWFDPDREYEALLDHLAGLPLRRFEGSLLEVRYRLIHRAPGERAVVYLPLSSHDAEVLRPFFATSMLFRERLYRFLRRQDLGFPDDPQVAHELRALLPRLAARSVGKGRAFWAYNLANLERARETLLGNFDDALLCFLARPEETLAGFQNEQLDGLFFAQLESTYGLVAAPEDGAQNVSRRLAAQLILTCAYVQAEANLRTHGYELPDFPYPDRLAEPLCRDRCWAFVTRWQYSGLYGPVYARMADDLEARYDLTRWAVSLPDFLGLTLRATFANVQEALWGRVQEALASLESEDVWYEWLRAHDGPIYELAQSFWALQGRDPGWALLALARDLLTAIHGLRKEIDRWHRPADVLQAYAEGWYCIDQDYRRLREGLDAAPGSHDRLRDRCARSYRDVLQRMNDRFCALLEAEATWPPEGQGKLFPQSAFWSEGPGTSKPGKRMAVMYVDALRYELAQELWKALEDEDAGDRRELTPRLAAIPTVTSIGMAALLPGGDLCRVTYDDDWQVTIEDKRYGASGNLKDKTVRQKWLKECLPGVRFYNLDELLNTPAAQIPEADTYVVFDTTLDAVGETASTLAWNTFGTLLRSVKKGVYKLLELGVDKVHIVADHGFLLLEDVGEHEKVSVRDVPALTRKSRYVVGRNLGYTDQLSFPVPGSEDLVAWFPRGIGCFRTPGSYNYVHGGLSLQELVVPHLQVTQQVMGRPVGVRAELPEVIRSAQFRIRLEPVASSVLDQPRQVTLYLIKGEDQVIPPLSCVVSLGSSPEVDVFLPMGCGLESGDAVRLVLRDAVTDEVLVESEATSYVDLW